MTADLDELLRATLAAEVTVVEAGDDLWQRIRASAGAGARPGRTARRPAGRTRWYLLSAAATALLAVGAAAVWAEHDAHRSPPLSLAPAPRKSRVTRQPGPAPTRLWDVSDTAEVSAAALGLAWLEELYRLHAAALLRLAVLLTRDRATAEDVVHDAFVALHRTGRRPQPGAELAYLRRTVTNLVVGRGRRAATAGRARLVPVADMPSPETASLRSDDRRALAGAVRGLPRRQRACIVLRYWGDLGDAEIAATLGISAGAVKSHLHRAKATLAGRLEDRR